MGIGSVHTSGGETYTVHYGTGAHLSGSAIWWLSDGLQLPWSSKPLLSENEDGKIAVLLKT